MILKIIRNGSCVGSISFSKHEFIIPFVVLCEMLRDELTDYEVEYKYRGNMSKSVMDFIESEYGKDLKQGIVKSVTHYDSWSAKVNLKKCSFLFDEGNSYDSLRTNSYNIINYLRGL